MVKQNTLVVQESIIRTTNKNKIDYISLTDIAKQKNAFDPKDVVKNWMRTKNTIEFLGLWELLNNPNFNRVEIDPLLKEAGSNAFTLSPSRWIELTNSIIYANEADVLNMALFGQTAKEWRDANPELKGNVRDYAGINELICLSNLENLNAVFIYEGLSQQNRLIKLNQIAIQQMTILQEVEERRLLK